MSKDSTSTKLGTDWEAIDALLDDQIVTDDENGYDPTDPESVADFREGASITHKGKTIGTVRRPDHRGPKKVPTTVRLSPEVIEYLRATGNGWQMRMSQALKEWIAAHRD
jgi:uncharacterized protein (DUF4415 family)